MSRVTSNGEPAQARSAQIGAAAARWRGRLARMSGLAVVVGSAVVVTLAAITGASGAVLWHRGLAPLSTLGPLRPPPFPGWPGPEGVPVPYGRPLAVPGRAARGQPIDHIGCQPMQRDAFHIHARLTIFVNGSPRQIPAAIGIPGPRTQYTAAGPFIVDGACYYWLHTHAADGIIHTESPVRHIYTLGEFFDIWGQPLSGHQVGTAVGQVTAIYDHQVYQGNPRDIPLYRHAQIQLEVGTPLIAPENITWPGNL